MARASFPRATAARLYRKNYWHDDAFASLQGITHLDMADFDCQGGAGLGDDAFKHLPTLESLHMSDCRILSFTNAVFAPLGNLQVLDISFCTWQDFDDGLFQHLPRLTELTMIECDNFTDEAFSPLKWLTSLTIDRCDFSDDAFKHLHGLTKLSMAQCDTPRITDAAFDGLEALEELDMRGCCQLTDAALAKLPALRVLTVDRCTQLTDAAFGKLANLVQLSMCSCSQPAITDAAFKKLARLEDLDMSGCTQATLTDDAFAQTPRLRKLCISGCKQFTDAAFKYFGGVSTLDMSDCSQATVTGAAFASMAALTELDISGCEDAVADAAFAASVAGYLRRVTLVLRDVHARGRRLQHKWQQQQWKEAWWMPSPTTCGDCIVCMVRSATIDAI